MEQLQRAERYLTKLSYAYEGIQASSAIFSIEDPKDDCISFFMHCYHVRDWIQAIYCPTRKEKQRVDEFINCNKELRICADICNGSKHYKITRKSRSGSDQKIDSDETESSLLMTGSGGIEIHKCSFSIMSDSEAHDALELATKCIALWRSYVSELDANACSRTRQSRAADVGG